MGARTGAMLLQCLVLILGTTAGSLAAWVHDGLLICGEPGNQGFPNLVALETGGAIMAWGDSRSDIDDIYAQKVDADGVLQWAENAVPICTEAGQQLAVRIITDCAGGAIVSWRDNRYGIYAYDIFAQHVGADGTLRWDSAGVPVCTASTYQGPQSMASDGTGGTIIVWFDSRSADVYAQRVDAYGVPQWEADGVNISRTDYRVDLSPGVRSDSQGGAIIAWNDARRVYVQRVDADGIPQWGMGGVAICQGCVLPSQQTIAPNGASGAIITWRDRRSEATTGPDIYAQEVDATGLIQWATGGVAVCTAPGDQFRPGITTDGLGGAIIVWQDDRDSDADIYAQRVDGSGNVLWCVDGTAICTALGIQRNCAIAPDHAGGVFLAWEDPRSGGGIYAQAVDAAGTVRWLDNGIQVCTAPRGQGCPHIALDGMQAAIITWEDYRLGHDDIYAQRIKQADVGVDTGSICARASLCQNMPNPFRCSTTIRFNVPKRAPLTVHICNLAGQRVRLLAERHLTEAGLHALTWDGCDDAGGCVAAGVYFYSVQAGSFQRTGRMVLLK